MKFFLILAFVAVASAQVNLRTCVRNGAGLRLPDFFQSASCTAAGVCTISRAAPFVGRAGLTSTVSHSSLVASINAQWLGISFPMPIDPPHNNICSNLEGGRTCPTTANTQYVWALNIPFNPSVPQANNVDLERKYLFT